MNQRWSKRLRLILAGLGIAVVLNGSAGVAVAYNDSEFACAWRNTTPLKIYFEWGPNLIGNPSYTWRLRFSDSVGDW